MPDAGDARPLVLITGAAGTIGSQLVPRLGGRWRLLATDLRPRARAQIEALDVTDSVGCRAMFAGADAVVHLAADPDPQADWNRLRGPNIEGAYVVAAAARDCGVRRLVLASSLQAVSAYPDQRQRRAGDPPLPANLYGASKAWAEALGAWVGASSPTSVVALRIGYFAQRAPCGEEATSRDRSAWLSPDDCARLVQAAVESDVTGLVVVNGISANRYRLAELGDAEARIGYRPADDAWALTEESRSDHND